MTRDEFIDLIAESGDTGKTEYLKEYLTKNRVRFFSKSFFVDEFLAMIIELDEVYPEQPIIQVIYTITEDFMGPLDLIPYIDDKDYGKMIIAWLRAMISMEYSIIDKKNNDFDIVKELFGE